MLLVLDSNEFIFGFGIARKPSCETLLDALIESSPHSLRIPRLIIEEVLKGDLYQWPAKIGNHPLI